MGIKSVFRRQYNRYTVLYGVFGLALGALDVFPVFCVFKAAFAYRTGHRIKQFLRDFVFHGYLASILAMGKIYKASSKPKDLNTCQYYDYINLL
jgi:hypothetical protein